MPFSRCAVFQMELATCPKAQQSTHAMGASPQHELQDASFTLKCSSILIATQTHISIQGLIVLVRTKQFGADLMSNMCVDIET